MGAFETAGANILRKLEGGLHSFAVDVMRESLVECPISNEETYIPQVRTLGAGPGRQLIFLGDDPDMTGDNGTLRRSSRVFKTVVHGNEMTVTMGYGFGEEENPAGRRAIEYAVPVHERHELNHEPPTKSGFLQDPLHASIPQMGPHLSAAVKSNNIAPNYDVTGSDLGA